MKKLLFILSILVETENLSGQNSGFNFEGGVDNFNPLTASFLSELPAAPVIRSFGANAKFYHWGEFTIGNGMDSLQIVRTFDTLPVDENGTGAAEARETILNTWRSDGFKTTSNLVTFADAALVKNSPVIWVLNVFNGTPEESIEQLDYLFSRGVNVVGVEHGNECFAWFDDVFEWYQGKFEPHLIAIRNKYPLLKQSLVGGSSKSHVLWNNKLETYIDNHLSYDLRVTIHTYLTPRECTVMQTMTEFILIPGQMNVDANNKFTEAWECMVNVEILVDEVKTAKSKYGTPVWCTEWNSKPSSTLINSVVNGAWMFKTFYELAAECEYVTNHNGLSGSSFGNINRAGKYDLQGLSHEKRTGYWSLFLHLKYPNAIEYTGQTTEGIYYYTNMTDLEISLINTTVECVNGNYPYSSAGQAGYMATGTPRSKEITGIKTFDYIPKWSYGIIKIEEPPCTEITFYADTDVDGYGDINFPKSSCDPMDGYVLNSTDCNDAKKSIHPGAADSCDNVDNDCDKLVDENLPTFITYEDNDGDGFGKAGSTPLVFCSVLSGYSTTNTDCNDADKLINKNAVEVCDNTMDENCDGIICVTPPPPTTCLKKAFLPWKKCKTIPYNPAHPEYCNCNK